MQYKTISLFLLFSTSCLAQQLQPTTSKTIQEKLNYFLQLTDSLRKIGQNPGLSMTIIYNNAIIYKKSVGLSNRKKKLKVTNNTLFEIGSLSKGFTGMLAAQLVDQNNFNWDDSVIKFLPELRFKDDYATRNTTIKDLLTHKTGLFQHYHLLFGPKLSTEEILKKLPFMSFGSTFREKFLYNNFTYVLAGMVLERATNKSFNKLLQENIFNKLSMLQTFSFYSASIQENQLAIGYLYDGKTPAPKPQKNSSTFSPAGSIISSLNDMSTWLHILLSHGKFKKESIVSKKQFNYVISPLVVRNALSQRFYGIGWDVIMREKYQSISHDGVTDGHRSRILFVPELGFGMVVLTNHNNVLPSMLTLLAERIFLQDSPTKTNDIFNYQKNNIDQSKHKKKHPVFTFNKPLFFKEHKGITGIYKHPAYGKLTLHLTPKKQIIFEYYGFKGSLKFEEDASIFAYVNHYLGKEKYEIKFHKDRSKNVQSITVYMPNTLPLKFIKTP